MTAHTRTRRVSVPGYYLGRPAALWLAALAQPGYGWFGDWSPLRAWAIWVRV
jgi:hypothetical protein